MNKVLSLLILCVYSISFQAYGQCTASHCTGAVKTIYVGSEATYIEMDQDMSKLNCNLLSGQYLTLKNTHTNRDTVFLTLLAAHTAKSQKVSVRVVEETDDCQVSYVVSRH